MASAFPDAAVPLLLEHIPFAAALYGSNGVLLASNDLLRRGTDVMRSLFPSSLRSEGPSSAPHPIQSFISKAVRSSVHYYEDALSHEGYIFTIRCNISSSSSQNEEDVIACLSVRSSSADHPRSPTHRLVSLPCKPSTTSGEQFECLYQLFQRAPLLIGFTDLSPLEKDCIHLWVNPAYVSALGPIKGESCSAHLLPASFIEWTSALYRAREQGSFSTKIRLTWHSSASRILRLWLFRVRGDRVGWIGNDETDMEDLTDDLQGMRCLFEIAPISLGLVRMADDGADYSFSVCNSRMGQTYGLNPRVCASQVLDAGDVTRWLDAMSEAYAAPARRLGTCRRTTGRLVQFRSDYNGQGLMVSVSHINKSFFACVAEDVTAWSQHASLLEAAVAKRTKELEDALQVKNRFLAVVSHELRTPVAGVLGCMELLRDTTLNDKQKAMVATATTCGEQLSVVINDILDLVRVQEHKIELESQPLSLHSLLDDVIEISTFSPAWNRSSVELILDYTNGVDWIWGDVTRIRQVLFNLISNAIKFTTEGEVHVTLTYDLSTRQVSVSVRDTGIGMSEAMKAKLFIPFSQADSSVTRRFGGSGLGLSISKSLARLMGGDLVCTASFVGVGSIFTLTWPLRPADPPTDNAPVRTQPKQSLQGLSVYVVARNATLRSVLGHQLSTLGCQVPFSASDWMTVVPLIGAGSTKSVILIESDAAAAAIPVISNAHPETVVVLMSYEYHSGGYFLKKPHKFADLIDILDSIVDTSRPPASPRHPTLPPLSLRPRQSPKARQPPSPPRSELRILVAEDNPGNQLVVKSNLEALGYMDYDIVANGRDAVEAARHKNYDVILMDIMMPVMDGTEAAQVILAEANEHALKPPVIVALTAHAFQEGQQRCLQVGMKEVLTKPMRRQALSNVLGQIAKEKLGVA